MSRKARDPREPHCTPEPTFTGRNAWVVLELQLARGTTIAEVTRWMVDQWINGEGRKKLLDDYKIDVQAYRSPSSNVVSIERGDAATRRPPK